MFLQLAFAVITFARNPFYSLIDGDLISLTGRRNKHEKKKKKGENNYLPYSNWSSLRCIALMHRHLRHSTCNLKAIDVCWGFTWLLPPYSLQGMKRAVWGPAAPLRLQNPGGRFLSGEDGGSIMPPYTQDASRNHRYWHPLSFSNDWSSATHFCWLTNSNLICRI